MMTALKPLTVTKTDSHNQLNHTQYTGNTIQSRNINGPSSSNNCNIDSFKIKIPVNCPCNKNLGGSCVSKHTVTFAGHGFVRQRDVVGLLTTLENKRQVMTKGGLTLLRHAYIQDERKETVRVTLWGEAANLIDETMVEMNKDEVKIVVITSMKVVYYEGADQLQSTYGTKIYINLDIPEATKLRQSLDELTSVTTIDISKEIHVPEPPFKSLKELLEMELPDEKEMFICQGAITEVRTDVDWRYRIMTTISDGFAFAKLVLFDKEAEKVIGKPINKLLDIYEQENGKGRVFDILQQCIGKQHKFKVKVGMSRFGYERELKGQKTFPTNEDIETKIVATQESEKAPMQQEEPSLPRIEWKAPVQTPDKTEKRKKAEKTGKGDKDIKMEGSSAKKKRSVAVSETST
ncbi:hypothetical protein KSS87_016535 [Heliosperma pusillum]|nr:hypothetical protein KSS87_016535 [Heliosperma pusillum]